MKYLKKIFQGAMAAALLQTALCNAGEPAAAATSDWRNMPDFVKKNIGDITRKDLASRQWPKVKIPGLKEQVFDANVKGINCVWRNMALECSSCNKRGHLAASCSKPTIAWGLGRGVPR